MSADSMDGPPGGLSVPGGRDRRGQDSGRGQDLTLIWAPRGRRLLSGLLGLNVVLLGTALVAGEAFNPTGLRHQEPLVFLLMLMGLSLAWMLWYLLWARNQPGSTPHTDHHAGGVAVTVVLMVFAGFSLLLHMFRMGYYAMMVGCKPVAKIAAPFVEAPFLALQTYLLWAHSKDCIHKHKIQTRSGLILMLSTDLLLWLNAVTEDTVHMEMELEREGEGALNTSSHNLETSEQHNGTLCRCAAFVACRVFRKGYEVLYPFNIEYYLMAGCMLYVMWKNVGRRAEPGHGQPRLQWLTLRLLQRGRVRAGPLAGGVVLLGGVAVFILYQTWVGSPQHRTVAFLVFYGWHLAVVPVMSLCSLAGTLALTLDRRQRGAQPGSGEAGPNPTRSLDVLLLLAAALGQLSLSYFSLVAALAVGPQGMLGSLDLAYSLLCLLELVLQNVFIIDGLHSLSHAHTSPCQAHTILHTISKQGNDKKETTLMPGADPLLGQEEAAPALSGGRQGDGHKHWIRRVIQEICAFLILANVMLWVIPAFGAHPQFESGLGKRFYGFTAWFILVNLGQPLGVFYRMHSVGALMELLISA
ncbi:hypothetical protein AGOR_G00195680 [Albula goreensis]|uniref:Otopetrin 3 n=1 Tax=Albula goreensis TaxID=1534307 RepID=A0A8T3CRK3_9TELE|nr:hypothetical protein AGOR_G00195680 [Albula goreensis]